MNTEQFRAFLWLRWRLRVNQFRKAGPINLVIFFVFMALALCAALGLFVAGFLAGFQALPSASPAVRLVVWAGAGAVFLFFWVIGLLGDLQRAEGVVLDRVLHLPVSPAGAFLINYLSSLFSVNLIVFVPGMVGLILGQACAGSVAALLALPLLAAFVLAVTAVTYQFQGWLAALMVNPRRRRTIVMALTAGFVMLAQVPNMLNVTRPWAADQRNQPQPKPDLTPDERAQWEVEQKQKRDEKARESRDRIAGVIRTVCTVFPPGWLALGAADLGHGDVAPALLGTVGLGAIGVVSLRRAYRTTLRLYTGAFTGSRRTETARPAPADPNRLRLTEWRLPWVSEHASAVATAAFRGLLRAPEVKMAILTPLILLCVSLGGAMSSRVVVPSEYRPLLVLGGGVMVLVLCGVQLVGNQFGYDRAGFRAYVLSPAPRREILLGKNLAVAPIGLGLSGMMVAIVGTVYPMRADHYPAVFAQLVTAYLLFCLLANAQSILAPFPMAAGTLQPARVKFGPVLLQLVLMTVLPLVLLPVLVPLAAEVLLAELAGVRGYPVSLVLSLFVLAVTALVYRVVLSWEGHWLATRERAILAVVTDTGA
ncbi:hypothetical protein R5W24_002693 [Gemmata sp. JC717]|uniref:hypothetical protein n=1 Tax=Gemmata algarum TaxID=2975278 RepID=UPI0021BA91F5|nr:hypothetical protein [Gemmata algarum]MDY3553590.1 hypothetical protein [Gemmata algarum]